MRGRGRMVLSMVVACALMGVLAPGRRRPPRRLAAQQRLRPRLEVRAGQPGRHHRPHRRVRPRRRPRLRRRGRGAAVDLPHDWSIELDPTTDGTNSGTGFLPGRPRLVPQDLHAAALGRATSRSRVEFDGVYMDSVVYFNGKQVASHPYGYTGFAVDLTGRAHRRPHAQRARRQGPQPAAQQPLVLRQRHLPQRPPRRDRPGPRRAPRHVRDHARRREHLQAGLRERARAHRRRRRDRRDERRHPRPATPAGAPSPAADRRRRPDGTATADLRLRHPHLWSTDDPVPLHARHRGPQGRQDRRPHDDDLRHPLVPLRPRRRASRSTGARRSSRASTCTTTRARSARRSTRTRSCAR